MKIKNQTPVSGGLAKQNCVGYALIDVVAKAYSRSFTGIIAGDRCICQAAPAFPFFRKMNRRHYFGDWRVVYERSFSVKNLLSFKSVSYCAEPVGPDNQSMYFESSETGTKSRSDVSNSFLKSAILSTFAKYLNCA